MKSSKGKKFKTVTYTNANDYKTLKEIGLISDSITSFVASVAMGILLIIPALMAIIAMFKQNIDFTMNLYIPMIKHLAFPFACAIVFLIYIIYIIRLWVNKVSIKEVLLENPTFIIFFFVSALIIISQFYNGIEYAILGTSAVTLGESFGMEIGYFVFILFGATQVKVESHKRNLLRIHCFISCVLVDAAFILWHTQVESTFFSDWTPRFSSIFSNTNYYGYYLVTAIPIAAAEFVYEKKKLWKIFSIAAFISNTVALSFNNSFGSWIGAFIAIIFIVIAYLIIEKKINWQTLILIPIFAICIFIPSYSNGTFGNNFSTLYDDVSKISQGGSEADNAGSGRWVIWKESMEIVYDNSFLGIGFEGVRQRGYSGPPYNIRPHNEFIQYAMFHGIPMVFFYFVGCLAIFIRALRKKDKLNGAIIVSLAGALGYLVGSFFGLTLFATGYFLFIFLGMGYVNDTSDSKADKKANTLLHLIHGMIIVGLIIISILLTVIFSIKGKGYYTNGIQNYPVESSSEQ